MQTNIGKKVLEKFCFPFWPLRRNGTAIKKKTFFAAFPKKYGRFLL